MPTDISICNTALLMVNADTINSFDQETREAALCSAMYKTTKESLLSKFSWSFSIFQELLVKTASTPLFDYDNEYQLPVEAIRILKTDGFGNDYRILKDKLHTNEDPVELLYQKDPGEALYPAYFVRVIEFKMAAILSLAMVQDENMAQLYEAQYLQSMREARATDSQNSPNMTIPDHEMSLTFVRGDDA